MIYVYTLNYRTGKITERIGEIRRKICYESRLMFDEYTSDGQKTGHYLTGLSCEPEKVRGAVIWFTKPNLEGAIDAFRKASRKMSAEYDDKSKVASNRIDKIGDE